MLDWLKNINKEHPDFWKNYLSKFETKPNRFVVISTETSGLNPAKDVILYICQPDEKGNYDMRRDNNHKRYVYHRAWIKTDADGAYTFYTFMPGKLLRTKELKQIQRTVKEPGKPEQELAPFFFNDDPLIPELTLACRAEAVKSMLRIEEKDGIFVANRDIRLSKITTTDL
jgi:protocatechuate 3,4-dioxygenase beta subunit